MSQKQKRLSEFWGKADDDVHSRSGNVHLTPVANTDEADNPTEPNGATQLCPDQGSAIASPSVDPALDADELSPPQADRDLGYIVDGTLDLKVMSDDQRLQFLKDPFVPPPKMQLLTQTLTKGKGKQQKRLTFQRSWLEKHSWLVYSKHLNGGLCKVCILFPPKTQRSSYNPNIFVKTAMTNLSKACGKEGSLNSHESSVGHRDAMLQASTFKSALENPAKTMPAIISKASEELYKRNLHILKSIVEIVLLCAKQSIALRGHRDDSSSDSANKGNFLAILSLLATHDPLLKQHIQEAPRNATLTSKSTQNEVISIMKDLIQEKIASQIRSHQKAFSIMADEVTEPYSNREFLALCLRFVDSSDDIQEVLFDLVELQRTTGASIAQAILNSLSKHQLDVASVRGQSYDGASSMSSARVGTQGRIREQCPLALYVHCHSHRLNLCVAAACRLSGIRVALDTINEVFVFFDASPKRTAFLEFIISQSDNEVTKKRLKGFCKTRWVERHTALETFHSLFVTVVDCLDAMTTPEGHGIDKDLWQFDSNSVSKASGLSCRLRSSDMIVSFIVIRNVLEFIRPIATKLQKRDGDIVDAYNMIDATLARLKSVRDEIDTEFSDWFQMAEELAGSVDTVLAKPRVAGIQRNRSNAPALNASEYYRRNVAVPFLDHVIQEMETRFPKSDRVGFALLQLLPSAIASADLEKLRQDLLFWEIDLPSPSSLKMELKEWSNFWSREERTDKPNIGSLIKSTDEDVFPNIKTLLRIGGTLPCTSVEAERSFSALRRTMTFTRSTMTDDRLAGLLLIGVHRSVYIDPEEVSSTFITSHRRKMFEKCLLYD